MAQLVGRRCALCRRSIDWVGDSWFCPECGAPVHDDCARTAVAQPVAGACPECGARRRRRSPPPDHAPSAADRARDRKQLRIIVVVVSVIVVTTLSSVLVSLLMTAQRVKEACRAAAAVDRATAAQEGQVWTMGELFAYLKAKGAVSGMQVVVADRNELPAEWLFVSADHRTVRVRRLSSRAEAVTDAFGNRQNPGFCWGRFSFVGDPVASDRFRQFLHG